MRDWLWRSIDYAGAGFAGGPLWALVPPSADSSSAVFPAPMPDAAIVPSRPPRRRRRGRRRQAGIAQECEAFLAGRYYELCWANNWRALPGWVWISALAQAELSELERLAHLSPSRHDPLAFLSYLADEVLLYTGGDEMILKRIQHDTLVPLGLASVPQESSSNLLKVARSLRDRLEHPATPASGLPHTS